MFKKRLLIILVIVCAVITALVVGIYTAISQQGKTSVSLIVVGKNSKVLVDNKPVRGNPLYLEPGKYKVSAQANGFKPASKDVVVGEDKMTVTLILSPDSEEAEKWAKAHEDDYLKAEAVAGKQARAEGEDFNTRNPLVRILPYKTDYYSIDYRVDKDENAIIQITSSSALGRQVALEKIRSSGFDLTDYTFEFINLANPFPTTGEAR